MASGTSTGAEPSLGKRTANAAVWNVATFVIGRMILLGTTVIAARLLAPEDFGLLGLALTVTTFLDALNDFGLTTAYVYFARRGDTEEGAIGDTAFSLNIVIGVLLTVVTIAAAPLVASFYNEPRVTPILVVLAFNFLIVSGGSIHDGRMRARLDFKKRFVAELGRSSTKGGLTIGLAVAGFGVWSLVLGQVVGTVASTVLYVALERWWPRVRLDRALAKSMLRYGFQLASVGMLGLAASNLDYVMIGRRIGADALGLYTIAFRLPSLAIRGTSSMISQVVFSAYAKLADDRDALRRGLLTSMRMLACYTVPMSLGMAVVGPMAVEVLFGPRWAAAGPLLRVLAVYTLLMVLVYNAGDVYKALGRPALLTLVSMFNIVLAAPLLWFAAGLGVQMVAYGQVVVASAGLGVQLLLLHRVLGVTPIDVLRALASPLAAGAALTATASATVIALSDHSDLLKLVAAGIVGVPTYLVALRVFDPRGFHEMLGLLRPRNNSVKEAA